MSATPVLVTLVEHALATANNDVAEAVRQVKKRLASDAALAAEVFDGLLEREVRRHAERVVSTVAADRKAPPPMNEERAAERAKGLALMAERTACLDYRLKLGCGGLRLAAADAADIAREIAALDGSLRPVIDLRRWLLAVRGKLTKAGQRVEEVFDEGALKRLRDEARSER